MAQKNNKVDQSLVEFVTQLKQLNDIEVEIPKTDIKSVIKDPSQYAKDFIEVSIAKSIPRYIKSYKLGKDFGKELNDRSKVKEKL